MKSILIAVVLSGTAAAALAQASAAAASPAASSAKAKPKWVQKLKQHRPASAAVNPELSPDKKGGN